MGKKSRAIGARPETADGVGPRQPCPCGSGRRYRHCHAAADADAPYVVRTFAGLPGECDWVAMREFVPAARATVNLLPEAFGGSLAGRTVRAVTVLPGLAPGLVRDDGEMWVSVQLLDRSADPSRDICAVVERAALLEPGSRIAADIDGGGSGQRLQDVVDPSLPFTIEVMPGFDFWFEGVDDPDGSVAAGLESVNDSISPTTRLGGLEAAYWIDTGTREYVRWVLPHDEDRALDALSRMHAAGEDAVIEGSRLIGSFRAHGLLVPVWDLPVGTGAGGVAEPMVALAGRLSEALAAREPLTAPERSARSGLTNRQLTIR